MPWIELVAERRRPQALEGVSPPQNAKDWFRVENSADDADSTDVFVYDSIGGWFGMYADEFITALGQITTSKISLRLNSPGGSVFEGIAIANAIRSHPATVTVYVDSLAASIASVIAMSGDRLVMMPQSQIMVHNASGVCQGDAAEMTKMAELLDKQSRNIAEAYAQHTGRPLADWQQYMADETWFTADEAVAAGLADEAMPMRPKKGEQAEDPADVSASTARTWDLSMFRYAGREQAPDPMPESPFASGGTVITAGMTDGITLMEGELVVSPSAIANMTRTELLALMREAVHDEVVHIFDAIAPKHSTAVEDGTWDAGANEKRLPSPVPVATVKKVYTYWDADAAEDGGIPKSACKLPHHFVSEDGTPGAASVSGVRNALARLPQTQGLSDAERSAAEAHLQSHLNAFKGGEEDHVHDDPAAEVQPDDSPTETPPADETPPPKAPTDEADDWKQLVGFLVSPTSSCADDVFAHVEEW